MQNNSDDVSQFVSQPQPSSPPQAQPLLRVEHSRQYFNAVFLLRKMRRRYSMKVIRAKILGYCMGVRRAVETACSYTYRIYNSSLCCC